MNQEESVAEKYLKSLSLGQVIFEPDGNIPPDFSVRNSIGVEVRRLNQQYFKSPDPEGLEQLSFPLWDLIKEETSKFDSSYNGNSYWIGFEFSRPYKISAKDTARSIKRELQNFLNSGKQAPIDLSINKKLMISLFPGTPVLGKTFRMGAVLDHDSGGAVLSMYIDNINHCIDEKSIKIDPYKKEYKDWWLVMVDALGWGLDTNDVTFVKSGITGLKNFDRLIIISYGNGQLLLDM